MSVTSTRKRWKDETMQMRREDTVSDTCGGGRKGDGNMSGGEGVNRYNAKLMGSAPRLHDSKGIESTCGASTRHRREAEENGRGD